MEKQSRSTPECSIIILLEEERAGFDQFLKDIVEVFSDHGPRRTLRMHYRYPTSVAERRALGMSANARMIFQKFMVVGHSWRPESWVAAPTAREQAARPPTVDR